MDDDEVGSPTGADGPSSYSGSPSSKHCRSTKRTLEKLDVGDLTEGAEVFAAFEKPKNKKTLQEKASALAVKGYERAMSTIGHRLLSNGVDMELVGELCAEPEDKSKRLASKAKIKAQL